MEGEQRQLRDGRQLILRKANVEDAPAVLAHLASIFRESDFLTFGPHDFEADLSNEEEHIWWYLESPLRLFQLAFLGGELVGTVTFSGKLRPRIQHAGDVGILVRRACWGSGVGSALLDSLIDWARQTGVITKLNLRVRVDNARAIRLYERKGFRVEGTVSRELLIDGRYFSQHHMGLEL